MSVSSASQYSNIPIPDPSLITAQEIAKAKSELREEFKQGMAAQAELLVTAGVGRHEKALLRIDAVEAAAKTFQDNLNRVPTQLDREASRITALFEEKLTTLRSQLDCLRNFADAMRVNAMKAIESAFVGAEKVSDSQRVAFEQQISKSEAATTKELDGIKALINNLREGMNTQITNLTDRINRDTGAVQGVREARVSDNMTNVAVAGYMAGGAAVLGVLISIFVMVHGSSSINPTVGADTKRVDDLITQQNEQNREMGLRMDALSARINAITTPTK